MIVALFAKIAKVMCPHSNIRLVTTAQIVCAHCMLTFCPVTEQTLARDFWCPLMYKKVQKGSQLFIGAKSVAKFTKILLQEMTILTQF